MEPTTFPKDDPGPRGLMTLLETEQNLKRLDWVLRRGEGYIGLVASMGSAYLASKKDMAPVFEVVQSRGLMFLDNGATPKSVSKAARQESFDLPHAVTNDRSLDGKPCRTVQSDQEPDLEEVEALAKDRGDSVAIGRPYPATLESVAAWAAGLKEPGRHAGQAQQSWRGFPPPSRPSVRRRRNERESAKSRARGRSGARLSALCRHHASQPRERGLRR